MCPANFCRIDLLLCQVFVLVIEIAVSSKAGYAPFPIHQMNFLFTCDSGSAQRTLTVVIVQNRLAKSLESARRGVARGRGAGVLAGADVHSRDGRVD